MSEQKIKNAIDGIQPESGAKERMLQNIRTKARKQKAQKKPGYFLRYGLPVAACICLLAVSLFRLLPEDAPSRPTGHAVQGGNPFTDGAAAVDFQALGITLDAPADAQRVSRTIVGGNTAEVYFLWNGKGFLARASAAVEELSGLHGQVTARETLDAQNNLVLSVIRTEDKEYELLTWTEGTVRYCLYGTDGADRAQVLSAYEALIK